MAWTNIFDGGISSRFYINVEKNWNYVAPEDYEVEGIELSVNSNGEIYCTCPEAYRLQVYIIPIEGGDIEEAVRLVDTEVYDSVDSEALLSRSKDQDPSNVSIWYPSGTVSFSPYDTMWRTVSVTGEVGI